MHFALLGIQYYSNLQWLFCIKLDNVNNANYNNSFSSNLTIPYFFFNIRSRAPHEFLLTQIESSNYTKYSINGLKIVIECFGPTGDVSIVLILDHPCGIK